MGVVCNTRDISGLINLRNELEVTRRLLEKYSSELHQLRQQHMHCLLYTSKLYAKEGAKVVIADFNAEKAQKVVDEIIADGGVARFYHPVDVSDRAQVESVVEKTVEELSLIHI